jgi:hypothetical protein
MSLQECLDGEVYYFAQRDHAEFISPRFMDDLTELVSLSHAAKLYDIDLHAMNVMVDRKAGGPKLFDFNQIPFTERPQNPFIGLALKLGLLGRESRDLRKLKRFNNYDRVRTQAAQVLQEAIPARLQGHGREHAATVGHSDSARFCVSNGSPVFELDRVFRQHGRNPILDGVRKLALGRR